MIEKTVQKEVVEKALKALQDLASGEKLEKGNTISTDVPAMVGESGKTQLFATGSDSNPSSWAGTTETAVPSNGATDGVSENGTDYAGSKGIVKSILSLLSDKKITADVAQMLLEKALPFEGKETKEEEDEEKKVMDKEKVKKSQAEDESVEKSLTSSPSVSDAFEVSDFLKDFVTSFAKALNGIENRLSKKIEESASNNGAFQKSLTSVVSTLGQAVVSNTQRVEEIANQPVRAPKSVQVINKSFGAPSSEETLDKDTILKSLVSLNEDRKVTVADVMRFESGGQISEEVLRKVKAHVSGK